MSITRIVNRLFSGKTAVLKAIKQTSLKHASQIDPKGIQLTARSRQTFSRNYYIKSDQKKLSVASSFETIHDFKKLLPNNYSNFSVEGMSEDNLQDLNYLLNENNKLNAKYALEKEIFTLEDFLSLSRADRKTYADKLERIDKHKLHKMIPISHFKQLKQHTKKNLPIEDLFDHYTLDEFDALTIEDQNDINEYLCTNSGLISLDRKYITVKQFLSFDRDLRHIIGIVLFPCVEGRYREDVEHFEKLKKIFSIRNFNLSDFKKFPTEKNRLKLIFFFYYEIDIALWCIDNNILEYEDFFKFDETEKLLQTVGFEYRKYYNALRPYLTEKEHNQLLGEAKYHIKEFVKANSQIGSSGIPNHRFFHSTSFNENNQGCIGRLEFSGRCFERAKIQLELGDGYIKSLATTEKHIVILYGNFNETKLRYLEKESIDSPIDINVPVRSKLLKDGNIISIHNGSVEIVDPLKNHVIRKLSTTPDFASRESFAFFDAITLNNGNFLVATYYMFSSPQANEYLFDVWNNKNEHVGSIYGWSSLRVSEALTDNSFVYSMDENLHWVSQDLKHKKQFKGHTHNILCIRELIDGNIITSSVDKTIRVWNREGKCIKVLQEHKDRVNLLVLSNNGDIISGSSDKTIRIWDSKSFECKRKIILSDAVKSLCVDHEGNILAGFTDCLEIHPAVPGVEPSYFRKSKTIIDPSNKPVITEDAVIFKLK